MLKNLNQIHPDTFQNMDSDVLVEINQLSAAVDELLRINAQLKKEDLNENDILNTLRALKCSNSFETHEEIVEKDSSAKYLDNIDEFTSLITVSIKKYIQSTNNCIENVKSVLSLVHLR